MSTQRSAEQLFADLEPVALAVEGSDLGTVERSGLPRLRCSVCHFHHKWEINSPAAVREVSNSASTSVSL